MNTLQNESEFKSYAQNYAEIATEFLRSPTKSPNLSACQESDFEALFEELSSANHLFGFDPVDADDYFETTATDLRDAACLLDHMISQSSIVPTGWDFECGGGDFGRLECVRSLAYGELSETSVTESRRLITLSHALSATAILFLADYLIHFDGTVTASQRVPFHTARNGTILSRLALFHSSPFPARKSETNARIARQMSKLKRGKSDSMKGQLRDFQAEVAKRVHERVQCGVTRTVAIDGMEAEIINKYIELGFKILAKDSLNTTVGTWCLQWKKENDIPITSGRPKKVNNLG